MGRLRIAGALWIVVAVMAMATTVVFRVDQAQIVVTLAMAVAVAVLGSWIVARPRVSAIAASFVGAGAWLLLYVALAVLQSNEVAAWVTDAFLAVVGIGPALIAASAGGHLERGESRVSR